MRMASGLCGFSVQAFHRLSLRLTSRDRQAGGEVKVRQALFRNSDRAAQISAAELGDEKAKGRWEGGRSVWVGPGCQVCL